MENLKTIVVHGRKHVLCAADRAQKLKEGETPLPPPNYCGTGLCLCGILKKYQTLEEFTEERIAKQEQRLKIRAKEAAKSKKLKEQLDIDKY